MSETKKGRMARRSITLRTPLKNFHFSGELMNRSMYSNVNQVMQMVSIKVNCTLSEVTLSSDFSCKLGNVLRVSAMVESTMNKMETTATT